MISCIISGKMVGHGVIDRAAKGKPNLEYIDVYSEYDADTHRIFGFKADFDFGKDVLALVNVYDYHEGREYIKFVRYMEG